MQTTFNNYKVFRISKFVLLLLLITISDDSFAQSSEFDRMLDRYELQFRLPKGYEREDSRIEIINGISDHLRALAQTKLKSKDGNMLIAISVQPIDTTRDEAFVKSNGDIWNRNRNYIPFNQKYNTFPLVFSRGIYNADVAGTWNLVPFRAIPILSKDENCRVIFLHKDNMVDVEIYHFYSNITQEQLAKRLRRLQSMIYFKKDRNK